MDRTGYQSFGFQRLLPYGKKADGLVINCSISLSVELNESSAGALGLALEVLEEICPDLGLLEFAAVFAG
jgi:hypothetical protein